MKPKVKAFVRSWGERQEVGVEVTNGMGIYKKLWSQMTDVSTVKDRAAMADSDALTVAMALEHCGIPVDFETTCY